MNEPIVQVLTYSVLLRATDDRLVIGTTKLIKLIYLIDCEFYKWHRQILTGADWVFFHYGPYSASLIDAINRTPGIVVDTEVELEDGRSFRHYRVQSFRRDPISNEHFSVRGPLELIYKQWAACDLALLLDHVYYETPPMLAAIRNQLLDFSLIPNPKDVEVSKPARDFSTIIPVAKKKALQEKLKEQAARYRVQRRPMNLLLEEEDQVALEAMGDRD